MGMRKLNDKVGLYYISKIMIDNITMDSKLITNEGLIKFSNVTMRETNNFSSNR